MGKMSLAVLDSMGACTTYQRAFKQVFGTKVLNVTSARVQELAEWVAKQSDENIDYILRDMNHFVAEEYGSIGEYIYHLQSRNDARVYNSFEDLKRDNTVIGIASDLNKVLKLHNIYNKMLKRRQNRHG